MLLVASLLFILLSPGILLTLPPVGASVFMSGKTSLTAVLVHAVLFFLLLKFWKRLPFLNRIEGFATAASVPGMGSLGGACLPNGKCGADRKCIDGICRLDNRKLNEKCNANVLCASSLMCDATGKCIQPPGSLGADCLPGSVCDRGFTCLENKCKIANVSKGGRCDENKVCASDFSCLGSQCKKTNLALGELCSVSDVCSGGLLCDANKCKTSSSLAGPCDAFNGCPPPLVCNRGVCMTPQ